MAMSQKSKAAQAKRKDRKKAAKKNRVEISNKIKETAARFEKENGSEVNGKTAGSGAVDYVVEYVTPELPEGLEVRLSSETEHAINFMLDMSGI